MKTYTQLLEDISLIDAAGFDNTDRDYYTHAFNVDRNRFKNLGKIHKDYSLHRHGDDGSLLITHDKTSKVIGRIHGKGSAKKLEVSSISVHPKHTKKKIGHSIAVAAYKHLHGMGVDVHSDNHQSPGGASVWHALMKDPDTSKHVHAVRNKRIIGQASKMKTKDIWTSAGSDLTRQVEKKGIRPSMSSTPSGEKARETTLVLKGKKKR